MDIMLSISLLASDHRKSLERCLDSLKPLLVKIPCELIIVFTGTSETVRNIAEKYTPQIIPFPWCGDFSAARNAGLKEARGEWFLYLDDDEWFEDVDEICGFFLSGEYRHYHSAHYIQRNYLDWNGAKYSDFSAFRMVKRLPESCFQNPIHEELTPRKEPCKYFHTYVHHYGYVKESENERNQKSSRNIPLLLQSIREQPSFVKNYLQLAKEYDLEGNWRAAEEYCRKGRSICRNSRDPHSEGWLQAYLSYLLCEKPEKQQAILEIEAMIKKEHPSELVLLILYQRLIHLYKETMEPEKVIQSGLKFEKLIEKMDRREILWEQQSYGEFNEDYVKNPERLYAGISDCTACALELQDWENAAYFLQLFPWMEEGIMRRYYPDLEEWRAAYGSSFTSILLGIYKTLKGNPVPIYILLVRSLAFLESGTRSEGKKLYIQCMKCAETPYLQQILLRESFRYQIALSHLAARMGLDAWDVCAKKAVAGLPFILKGQVMESAEKLEKSYPFHSLCLRKQALGQNLLKGFYLWEELTAALEEYCQCVLNFYKLQYREEMFAEESRTFLPNEYKFAAAALEALDLMEQGHPAESVRLFRKCIQISPTKTGVINELLRQAMRRVNDPALHTVAEFRQLAAQMKGTLNTLLDAGQNVQAAEILNQLLPLMPEDTELIRMRQELIRRTRS